MAKATWPGRPFIDALVQAGILGPNEPLEIMQIVIVIDAQDVPIMYVKKFADVDRLAVSIAAGGIQIERKEFPSG